MALPDELDELWDTRAVLNQPVASQVAWLQAHPESPFGEVLRDRWIEDDASLGLVAWFMLFPLDREKTELEPQQFLAVAEKFPKWAAELDQMRMYASEPLGTCQQMKRVADACANGDPTLALQRLPHLSAQDNELACLDAEVQWSTRNRTQRMNTWDEAAFGVHASCVKAEQ